ncbi:uncharacterized protein LOC106947290 isoform X1 [Poecilia latipinna]|uniref:uncharacterized protein LOC106947290 isoform X1 n=2 Tax=Poecilia latipinna TaxID=48699 RepID=UPI00072DFEF7|nr:PREDICTED: uncharacterized protein LOC106947290 isoform X1 [Poecilia latipinna]
MQKHFCLCVGAGEKQLHLQLHEAQGLKTKMSSNASGGYFNMMYNCDSYKSAELFSVAFMVIRFLCAVPVSIVVLCLGFRRRRRATKTSHSDLFIYNSAALQLVFGFAAIFYLTGLYAHIANVSLLGVYAASIAFPGEIVLHILTCMDRYLAVVHPVTYRGLTQSTGIRIRNISIVCAWLISFGWVGLVALFHPEMPYAAYFCLFAVSITSISFCSVSVLYVLIDPGPGKKEKADKAKRKAFQTIMAILGVLLVYFVASIVVVAVKKLNLLINENACLILTSAQWFGIPCSVALPLLFLRKAKKF